ncbi:hypothetical protein AA313_de0204279 [Arthrobotrys entomopaga]|nr:hypothetical protein AA313_de0204279 [Arthrobotrys entomopaga]
MVKNVLLGLALAAAVNSQAGPWAQCGGLHWPGLTSCVSGWTCLYINDYYSQCLQSTGATPAKATTTKAISTTTKATATSSTNTSSTKGVAVTAQRIRTTSALSDINAYTAADAGQN